MPAQLLPTSPPSHVLQIARTHAPDATDQALLRDAQLATLPVYIAAVVRHCGRDWAVTLLRSLMCPLPDEQNSAVGERAEAAEGEGAVWVGDN